MQYRPSRFQVILLYLNRAIRWRSNSYPYLSGDAFADLADFVFKPPRFRGKLNHRRLRKNDVVIFTCSDDLEDFFSLYPERVNNSIIIAGNSDREFNSKEFWFFSGNSIFFLQNSFISDNKRFWTLPIGLENLRLARNGFPKLMKYKSLQFKNNKVLIGPFGNTHASRRELLDKFKDVKGPWSVFEGYISPKVFSDLSNSYKYIAIFRGNGIDTHRLWETLYRGSIPILIEDDWISSMLYLELPILRIPEWKLNILENSIMNNSISSFQPSKVEALWMPYWEDLLNKMRKQIYEL
jgi:hypothetical protein